MFCVTVPCPWHHRAVVALLVCRLLDLVDCKRSALVIAPTSSGKTFISYYIMKLVLEERSTTKVRELAHHYPGVVLYVCPTKQLVNQVRLGSLPLRVCVAYVVVLLVLL